MREQEKSENEREEGHAKMERQKKKMKESRDRDRGVETATQVGGGEADRKTSHLAIILGGWEIENSLTLSIEFNKANGKSKLD